MKIKLNILNYAEVLINEIEYEENFAEHLVNNLDTKIKWDPTDFKGDWKC